MTGFCPNRKFRRTYDSLFKKDPLAANTLLLLHELADKHGQVRIPAPHEESLAKLVMERFADPRRYQL